MKKSFVRALLAAACAVAPLTQAAEPYPAKPVTVIVPYAPGGTTDVVARIFSKYFADTFKQPFVVENKPGGSTTIALKHVAGSKPDGYTLISSEMTMTSVPALFAHAAFDPNRDLMHLAQVAEAPYLLVVNPKVPAKTLKELIALAKEKPGELTFASGGAGSGPHLAGEMFKSLAGVDIRHIPYKGSGPALNDVVGGQVDMLLTAVPTASGFVASGRLRALAVTSQKRVPSMSSVPTAVEAGVPGFLVANWFGVSAPRGTPPEVGAAIHGRVKEMLKDPEIVSKLDALGAFPAELGQDGFTKKVNDETTRWTAFIKKAGIKGTD